MISLKQKGRNTWEEAIAIGKRLKIRGLDIERPLIGPAFLMSLTVFSENLFQLRVEGHYRVLSR